ncbi:MAG: complex I subunit 4 family protein [Bacteroidales bacterium]
MIVALLLILPLLVSFVLFSGKIGQGSKSLAIGSSIVSLAISLVAGAAFVSAPATVLTFDSCSLGLPLLDFVFKIDAPSMLLILLTTLLTPIIIASTDKSEGKGHNFYALILLMEAALIGVFSASDMISFYIFWELALIPIFFITAFWGGADAKRITMKFFIYTVVGSLLMLVAILYMYTLTPGAHSFTFEAFYALKLPYEVQLPLFLAFFAAFAIKIPLFPFHSWQAETYNVSPVQGSMLLAGIMLKMGLYGLFRFILPMFPDVLANGANLFLYLTLFGVIYGAYIAITQPHLKKLIAFASLSHVGIIALGLLTQTKYGIEGAFLQMFSHGVNVVGFFLCYYVIVKRTKTDVIANLGGIAKSAPKFATIFLIIVLANVALPLTNSFVGEFLILLGLFQYNQVLAAIAGLTVILGAVYMLKMYQKVMYGEKNSVTESFEDLTAGEMILFVPIVVCIFLIGIYPSFVLRILETVAL